MAPPVYPAVNNQSVKAVGTLLFEQFFGGGLSLIHLLTGHTNLPNVCPVCDHFPLSPDDCKANTALRTTVAVFLRTAEKKHNLLQQKEQKEKAKPIEPKIEVKSPELESDKTVPVHVSPVQNPLTPPQEVDDSARAEGQQALPQVSQVSL